MASRWKYDRPMSRAAFEARFPDEASCARHLAARRWPDGFVCPACGHDRGWELKRRRASWECAACGKETSVTAGTIMHRSHLPLKTWFMAVHIVTSHSNGISALQLQAQLGLGSYKSAWLLLHKLRRAMVDPDRSLLEDLIEIDEATLPFRTAKDPATGGQGRSPQGKMRIAGAVELSICLNRDIAGRIAEMLRDLVRPDVPEQLVCTVQCLGFGIGGVDQSGIGKPVIRNVIAVPGLAPRFAVRFKNLLGVRHQNKWDC